MKRSEKQIEAGIALDLRRLGWHVTKTSQHARPQGMTAGIPDLYAMHPRHGGIWIEVKTPKGRLRDSQKAWHADAERCGVPVVVARSTADVLGALSLADAPSALTP